METALATEPSGLSTPPARPAPGASLFVWGVWALMMLAALAFVGLFMSKGVPLGDDWHITPSLTRSQPITTWLMVWNGEHRLPLSRLLMKVLFKLSDNDFRAGAAFSVFALAALAALMVLVAKSVRGRTAYADAFFPLVLLNWGHYETFLQSYYVVNSVPVCLGSILLLIIVRSGTWPSWVAAVLAAACVGLLPLCGGVGLPYLPPFALWLGYLAALRWRAGDRLAKRDAVILSASAAVILALVALYFVGYPGHSGLPQRPGLGAQLKAGLQFLTMSLGPAAAWLWPASGLAMLGLVLAGVTVLFRVWRRQPQERFRAVGLLFFLGAMLLFALAVGRNRSGYSSESFDVGLLRRYAILAAPVLCCLYFTGLVYRARSPARLVHGGLCALAVVALPFNTWEGYQSGGTWRRMSDALERDLRAGVSPHELIGRYSQTYFMGYERELPLLRQAKVGAFQHLQPDPAFREVPLPAAASGVYQMKWENGVGDALGKDSYVTFALPGPRYVGGIRLKFKYLRASDKGAYALLQVFWKRKNQSGYLELRHFDSPIPTHAGGPYNIGGQHFQTDWDRGPNEKTLTVWVGEEIDQFRVHPDNQPCLFQISEIVLLVPVDDPRASSGR